MLLKSLAPVLFAVVPALAQDIVFNSEHNATTIYGTWSTGSKAVVTGSVRLSVFVDLPAALADRPSIALFIGFRKSGERVVYIS